MKYLTVFLVCAFAVSLRLPTVTAEDSNRSSRTRYLVLDDRIIEHTSNAALSVGTIKKHPKNPLFIEDKSWEMRFDNLYGNVVFDREKNSYQCWYSPFIVDHSSRGMSKAQRDNKRYRPPRQREMAICYATSEDGITWEKPSLGVVDFNGSKDNNIVWRGPHGAGVTKDLREKDPARRYKMIMQGLSTSYSADGIRWSKAAPIQGVGKIAGDTHNNLFWNHEDQNYVAITRTWGTLGRQVTRLQSSDFKVWHNTGVIMEAVEKSRQPYAMPVFFHGGVFLGLVAIHAQPPIDRVWTELAWSPDSKQWHRISPGEPLIPCSEKILDYDYGCVYPCAHPIFLPDEIRLYYGGSDYHHYGWRTGNLSLATLRPDGFAGYEQKSQTEAAIIVTKSITIPSASLLLNADIEPHGELKVTITDAKDHPLAATVSLHKTLTDKEISVTIPVSDTAASPEIKLRFELTNAKLYSFGFAP